MYFIHLKVVKTFCKFITNFFLLTVFSRNAKEGLHFLLCLVLLVCFLFFHGIMSNLTRPETRGPGALLEQIVILLIAL